MFGAGKTKGRENQRGRDPIIRSAPPVALGRHAAGPADAESAQSARNVPCRRPKWFPQKGVTFHVTHDVQQMPALLDRKALEPSGVGSGFAFGRISPNSRTGHGGPRV